MDVASAGGRKSPGAEPGVEEAAFHPSFVAVKSSAPWAKTCCFPVPQLPPLQEG